MCAGPAPGYGRDAIAKALEALAEDGVRNDDRFGEIGGK
jgi:hypothetical protein